MALMIHKFISLSLAIGWNNLVEEVKNAPADSHFQTYLTEGPEIWRILKSFHAIEKVSNHLLAGRATFCLKVFSMKIRCWFKFCMQQIICITIKVCFPATFYLYISSSFSPIDLFYVVVLFQQSLNYLIHEKIVFFEFYPD